MHSNFFSFIKEPHPIMQLLLGLGFKVEPSPFENFFCGIFCRKIVAQIQITFRNVKQHNIDCPLTFITQALELVSIGSILTNLSVFAITSHHLNFYFPTPMGKLIFVVVAEHLLIGLRWAIAVEIPDVPKGVEIKMKRQQYINSQLAKSYKFGYILASERRNQLDAKNEDEENSILNVTTRSNASDVGNVGIRKNIGRFTRQKNPPNIKETLIDWFVVDEKMLIKCYISFRPSLSKIILSRNFCSKTKRNDN